MDQGKQQFSVGAIHLHLETGDASAMCDFYVNAIGMFKQVSPTRVMSVAGPSLIINFSSDGDGSKDVKLGLVRVGTASIGVAQRLEALGVPFTRSDLHNGNAIHFQDPEGNRVRVLAYGEHE